LSSAYWDQSSCVYCMSLRHRWRIETGEQGACRSGACSRAVEFMAMTHDNSSVRVLYWPASDWTCARSQRKHPTPRHPTPRHATRSLMCWWLCVWGDWSKKLRVRRGSFVGCKCDVTMVCTRAWFTFFYLHNVRLPYSILSAICQYHRRKRLRPRLTFRSLHFCVWFYEALYG